jgi:tetratricopeptide (TPR) repeat protein/predicted Ser/Thr protein kinase
MDPSRWDKIKSLVLQAQEWPAEDRAALLADACSNDSDLQHEVESLLQNEARAAGFLEGPKPQMGLHSLEARTLIGRRIGQFEILELLGRGGMGVVYRARQQHPRRDVALKIVPGGAFVDAHRLRLFQREIQLLARLQHPGIAAIHEAGCTEDGQHFFAMELVDGVPLNEHLRRAQPPLSERLELFRRICEAIHYAHQRGVIHRDLKPSNILITRDGLPKVLDFGLAKITEADLSLTASATEAGRIQGTLAYMSPEQAQGRPEDIDLRTDVYALGVVLYELLTHRLPYDVGGCSMAEAIRRICDDAPEMPSSIDRVLRGDLDTIVAKALEKDPQRRYSSAAALADDVVRFLHNEPIQARPPSAWYQMRKFASRHKLPALLTAVFLVVIVAAAIVLAHQAVQLAEKRDAAVVAQRQEADARVSAEQVSQFLEQLFQQANPGASTTKEPTVRDLLEAGVQKLESELADQPLVRARLATVMGNVYVKLNDFPKARSLLGAAVETRRKELGSDHPDLAESLEKLASACKSSGDHDEAHKWGLESLQICEKHFGVPHERVAAALEELGSARYYAGDFTTALEYIQRSLEMSRTLFGEESEQVARALVNLGHVLTRQQRLDEAGQAFQSSLEIRRRLLGDHESVGLALDGLANFEFARGNPKRAEEYVAEEVEMYRRLYHGQHPRLAWGLNNLAFLVNENRGPEAAEPLYRDALAIRRAAYGPQHGEIAASLNDLAVTLADQKKFEEAIELHREALEMRRSLLGNERVVVAGSLQGLGEALRRAGRLEEAEPVLLEAHALFVRLRGESHGLTVVTVNSLVRLYEELDRPDDAAVWRAKLPPAPQK